MGPLPVFVSSWGRKCPPGGGTEEMEVRQEGDILGEVALLLLLMLF